MVSVVILFKDCEEFRKKRRYNFLKPNQRMLGNLSRAAPKKNSNKNECGLFHQIDRVKDKFMKICHSTTRNCVTNAHSQFNRWFADLSNLVTDKALEWLASKDSSLTWEIFI